MAAMTYDDGGLGVWHLSFRGATETFLWAQFRKPSYSRKKKI